jgi:adenosylcobyric acid synthase
VGAIRLPRISNSTDVEALACEPGVLVRWVTDPADLADSDVVVIPGSKATVADLRWLRDRGLADGIAAYAAQGKPVLGICGGFQMLCRHIDDPVESGARGVAGLGLLDADVVFAPEKTLRHHEAALHGYEIHHGQLTRCAEDDWLGVGIRRGMVYGTHWHGVLDNNDFRRRWLTETGPPGFLVADDIDVPARRDVQLDLMADLLTANLDVDAIVELLENGPRQRPAIVTTLKS